MLILGLTGGIASGKSLVARELAGLGVQVIDADEIAHQVMEDEHVRQEIADIFGHRIFRADGSIDRRALGEIIFSDEGLRERLNFIVHPKVTQEIEKQIDLIRQNNFQAIVVLDVPLLIESGLHRLADKLIVVSADENTQIQRLMQHRGLTYEQAVSRIKAQLPMREKIKLADYVIDNNGVPGETANKVKQIYQELMKTVRRT